MHATHSHSEIWNGGLQPLMTIFHDWDRRESCNSNYGRKGPFSENKYVDPYNVMYEQ